ncbi:MAG: hypothetical protein AAF267_19325 [Deinococcota bacterium]
MPKALKTPDLVSWHDNPATGHTKGLITVHVKQPYYVEISSQGDWALLTLGKNGKPRFVTSGRAKNVTKAKAAVTAEVVSKVPEIRAALAVSAGDVIDTKARVIEPTQVSTGRMTLRWYGKVSALILWGIFASYWWIRFQPRAATLSLLTLAVGLYLAHQVRRALTHEGDKLDKISRRRQLQQVKQIAQQSTSQPQVRQLRQPQPPHKALRP